MTRAMLMAVLDALFPGDEGAPPLPSASKAALDLESLEPPAEPLVTALGDGDSFLNGSTVERVAKLRAVEQASPEPFKLFLSAALAAYYESAPVLAALGWRSAPPQPLGHSVEDTDPATWQSLEKVRRRGKLWRD
ncbi:MAG: hypothetical protein ACREEP_05515 [Dongiaceae bacterium]